MGGNCKRGGAPEFTLKIWDWQPIRLSVSCCKSSARSGLETLLDDATDLAESLLYTLHIIVKVTPKDRRRIALAYSEAQQLMNVIERSEDFTQLRILACLKRFADYMHSGDVAAAGWMLTALEARIETAEPPHVRKFRNLASMAVDLLKCHGLH